MSNFSKCNKVSGFYSSTDKIEHFKFKVRLKEINKGIPILKTSLFDSNLESDTMGHHEDMVFSWQEKISKLKVSMETAKDVEKSDVQKTKNAFKQKLISYVNQDNYENEGNILSNQNSKMKNLSDKVHIYDLTKTKQNEQKDQMWKTDNKIENFNLVNENQEKMLIVADMNDYERDPTSLLNREHILFTLIWDKSTKDLIVSPNFNNLEENPYILEVSYDSKQIFHYSIEQIIPNIDKQKSAEILALTKISEQENMLRLRKKHQSFVTPPKEIIHCMIIFEIKSAQLFEYNNIYVEYMIELPYGYNCKNNLKGKTQISNDGGQKKAHFGHLFELNIDYDMQKGDNENVLPTVPQIYFEIISSDSWGRKRTEGYCYTNLPVMTPGQQEITLKAIRPIGDNKRLWNMTRYFTGGRHILKDITWINKPSTFQGSCLVKHGITCVNSGLLDVAMSIIIQNPSLCNKTFLNGYQQSETGKYTIENLHVDSLFKSVHNVLKAYKFAKEKLEAA